MHGGPLMAYGPQFKLSDPYFSINFLSLSVTGGYNIAYFPTLDQTICQFCTITY